MSIQAAWNAGYRVYQITGYWYLYEPDTVTPVTGKGHIFADMAWDDCRYINL